MAISIIQNLNGKIWIDRLWRGWKSSFSFHHVQSFLPVYAYWISWMVLSALCWFPGSLPLVIYDGLPSERKIYFNYYLTFGPIPPQPLYEGAKFFLFMAAILFIICCCLCIYFWIKNKKIIAAHYSMYVLSMMIFSIPVFLIFAVHFFFILQHILILLEMFLVELLRSLNSLSQSMNI